MEQEFRPIVTDYVTLTEEEFVKFSVHAYKERFARMKWLSILGAATFIAGFIIPSQLVVIAGLGLFGVGTGDIVYVKEYLKRTFNDPKNSIAKNPCRAIINERTIDFEFENGISSSMPWKNFIKIEELDGVYLLYISRYAPVIMLPRAQSPEDWKLFIELVEAKKRSCPP